MRADAVTVIEEDHRLLESLFERLQAGTGDRRALVREVAARLTAHARAEERQVYPAINKAAPDEHDEVEHAYHEHHEAAHLLRKVANLVESPHFDHALADLVAAVRHHVREEETEVLPALRNAVDAATLQRLGTAFADARDAELRAAGVIGTRPATASVRAKAPTGATAATTTKPATSGTGDRSGAAGAATAEPATNGIGRPADLTRRELYELARKAGIAGRSTMNKAELRRALNA